MINLKIIVAMARNNGIGRKGALPWSIKEDMKHFSKMTKGKGNNAVVMGRKTWESIGSKPLTKRDNLIISSKPSFSTQGKENIIFFNEPKKVIEFCKNKYDEVWVIGGNSIYDYFLKKEEVSTCYITYIDREVDDCDTFFPKLHIGEWCLKERTPLENHDDIFIEKWVNQTYMNYLY